MAAVRGARGGPSTAAAASAAFCCRPARRALLAALNSARMRMQPCLFSCLPNLQQQAWQGPGKFLIGLSNGDGLPVCRWQPTSGMASVGVYSTSLSGLHWLCCFHEVFLWRASFLPACFVPVRFV